MEVARPGLKVQARPGYFAPKNFRQFTREDKEHQLQQVMDLDVPFVDLPFVVETAYFRRPDKKFTVVLAAKIPGSQVAFLKKSGKQETEFDFAWKITDAQNHAAGALRDTLPVRVTNETYEEIIGSNLFYEGEVVLPPGKYNLKAVVRENETGKIGTFEAPLVVPDVADTALGLSSVVLSNEVKSSEDLDRAHVNSRQEFTAASGEPLGSSQRDARFPQQPDAFGLPGIVCGQKCDCLPDPPPRPQWALSSSAGDGNSRKPAPSPASLRSRPIRRLPTLRRSPWINFRGDVTPCKSTCSTRQLNAWPLRACPWPSCRRHHATCRRRMENERCLDPEEGKPKMLYLGNP